jgi:hypothetical protein
LEYYIEAAAGGPAATAPAQGAKAPFVVEISADGEPPALSNMRIEHALNAERATISVAVADASPMKSVRLFYKPMPSTARWESAPMSESDGRYTAEAPVTPEGLLCYVRAVDVALNAAMFPDFAKETPYRVIPPWPTSGQETRYSSGK